MIKRNDGFTCLNCGAEVPSARHGKCRNHCTRCLYSLHVDKEPGDRQELCEGLMEPVSVEKKGEKFILHHKCIKCGFERVNQILEDDEKKDIFIDLLVS